MRTQSIKQISFLVIHELEMIHTDLKPENILLKNNDYDIVAAPRTKVLETMYMMMVMI